MYVNAPLPEQGYSDVPSGDDLKNRTRFLNILATLADFELELIPVVGENDTKCPSSRNSSSATTTTSPACSIVRLRRTVRQPGGIDGSSADANHWKPRCHVVPCIEDVRALNLDTLCGGKTSVGTGGMYSELLSARKVAQLGVPPPLRRADRTSSLACSPGETIGLCAVTNSARFPP